MNRTVLVVFLALAVVILGVAGIGVVVYFAWPPKVEPPKNEPPFTYKELEDLNENPDKASKEIPRIIDCFENGDEEVRLMAAETLQKVGAKAVEPLRAKLTHKNANVRFCCLQSLAFLGPQAAAASVDVVKCLKDEDSNVRYKAVFTLGRLGVTSDAAMDGLLNALSDREENVQQTAAEVLENFGTPGKESLPAIGRLANNGTPTQRSVALKLMGRMGEPAAQNFKELLRKANTLDQIELIQAIAQLGKGAKPLLPDLGAIMVKNRFWDAQEELIATFKKCDKDGADGLASVLKTLHDPKMPETFAPNDDRSLILLKAIGDIGPDAKGTVPLLIELLKERESLQPATLDALGGIGPAASDAIPFVESLVKNPKDKNDPAVIALRRMGKVVGPPAPPLGYKELEELNGNPDKASKEIARIIACFEKGDEDLRLLAAETLKNVGVKAVGHLRASLTHKDANVRFGCLQALAFLHKDAASAVDDVLARVEDGNANVRYKAVYALGKLGVHSDAVFAGVIKALDDKDPGVTETALDVLDAMGTPPKAALPSLAKLATRGVDPVSLSALNLLAKMGEPAVPTFRELLKKKNVNERQLVIQAMVPLGANAKVLTPELLSIVTEQIYPGGFIDGNLYEILKKCGPDAARGLAEALQARNKDSIAFIARMSLLKAIGEMRAEAEVKETVPILIELLKTNTPTHPVVEYRHLILEALGDIGPAAKAAIPTVESLRQPDLKGLSDEQQRAAKNVAEAAGVALRRMGVIEKKVEKN